MHMYTVYTWKVNTFAKKSKHIFLVCQRFQWYRRRGRKNRQLPLNFNLSLNFLWWIQNVGLEILILRDIWGQNCNVCWSPSEICCCISETCNLFKTRRSYAPPRSLWDFCVNTRTLCVALTTRLSVSEPFACTTFDKRAFRCSASATWNALPRLHNQTNIEQTSSRHQTNVEQTSSKHRAGSSS